MLPLRPLIFSLGLLGGAAAQAQVVVVVNPKAGLDSLSTEQVAAFFLGKSSSLPGGLSQALDLPEANAARDQFYAKGAGKSASQVKATWARLAFSGKATPPKELANAAEVKKFVGAHADAVGYIEKAAVDGSVKVVLTIE
ncbi:hypothetical protein [Inhella sp.]|uniref:hypothetical protein n=1 Tax=Inhella sp. TaxID=1921806 RepID=UPI0035ADF93F